MTYFSDEDSAALRAHLAHLAHEVLTGHVALDDAEKYLKRVEEECNVRGYRNGSATEWFRAAMTRHVQAQAGAMLPRKAKKVHDLLDPTTSPLYRALNRIHNRPIDLGGIW